MKRRADYTFADITIYKKVNGKEKEYLNLTDFNFSSKNNEFLEFDSDSPYLMMMFSFAYEKYKKEDCVYVCDLTFDELLNLAGIHDKHFLKRFEISKINNNEELLAVMSARKIVNNRNGRVYKVDRAGKTCLFYRQSLSRKSRTGNKAPIFEKIFYKA